MPSVKNCQCCVNFFFGGSDTPTDFVLVKEVSGVDIWKCLCRCNVVSDSLSPTNDVASCLTDLKMGEHSFMAQLEAMVPLEFEALVLPSEGKRVGLVIVDEVNGFCTVGAGNLVNTPISSLYITILFFFCNCV